MDEYKHLEQSARGKIQSLCKRIEEEATRSDALLEELEAQRSISVTSQIYDVSSQDDKSERLPHISCKVWLVPYAWK